MPNTCSICKHEKRQQIENALARGNSLRDIARQGGGQYFELGNAPDQDTAFALLAAARQNVTKSQAEERVEPLYWYALLAAVLCACLAGALAARSVERRWLPGATVATLLMLMVRTI